MSCVVSLVTEQWVISGEERTKHDLLFIQQNPVGGYLSGNGCVSLWLHVLPASPIANTLLSVTLMYVKLNKVVV